MSSELTLDVLGECRERRAGRRARHLFSVLRPADLEALVAVTPTDIARERLLGVVGTGALRLRTRGGARGRAPSSLCSRSLLSRPSLGIFEPPAPLSSTPFDQAVPSGGRRCPGRRVGLVPSSFRERSAHAWRGRGGGSWACRWDLGGLFFHLAPSFAFPAPASRPGAPRLPPVSASSL